MQFRLRTLLIVLAVGPILMAVLFLPRSYGPSRADATRSMLSMLKEAVLHFKNDTGRLPDKLDDLFSAPTDPSVSAAWKGPYLAGLEPLDPWGEAFKYQRIDSQRFRVWSAGGDGKYGTPDDIEP